MIRFLDPNVCTGLFIQVLASDDEGRTHTAVKQKASKRVRSLLDLIETLESFCSFAKRSKEPL